MDPVFHTGGNKCIFFFFEIHFTELRTFSASSQNCKCGELVFTAQRNNFPLMGLMELPFTLSNNLSTNSRKSAVLGSTVTWGFLGQFFAFFLNNFSWINFFVVFLLRSGRSIF
jgi:hypothetical protein